MSAPMERLQALDAVEKDILNVLQSASSALTELSKEKTSAKQLDTHTSNFLKTLNHVEIELSKHINYLTQVSTGVHPSDLIPPPLILPQLPLLTPPTLITPASDVIPSINVFSHKSNVIASKVNAKLCNRVNLGQRQAHEGSSYASQKVLQMAWHRSEHARSRVVDLDRMKGQLMSFPGTRLQARTGLAGTPSSFASTSATSTLSSAGTGSSLNPTTTL